MIIDKTKRNYFLEQARRYARQRNIEKVQIYLEHAQTAAPISDLQIWRIREELGHGRFEKLDLIKAGVDVEGLWETSK